MNQDSSSTGDQTNDEFSASLPRGVVDPHGFHSLSSSDTMASGTVFFDHDSSESATITGPRTPLLVALQRSKSISTQAGTTAAQAIENVKEGCKRMDANLPKLAPTFTQCDIRGETFADPEKQSVGVTLTKCLKLRRQFVYWPTKYDRSDRRSEGAPVYEPPIFDPETELPAPLTNVKWYYVNGVAQICPSTDVFAEIKNGDELLTDEDPYLKSQKQDETKNQSSEEKTGKGEVKDTVITAPNWIEFCEALTFVVRASTNGPCKSYSHGRLVMLEMQKNLHVMLNRELELAQSKSVPHRDFYNVRKVDNHVHHSACMNQKHLLRYIKKKLREGINSDETVIERDGKSLTLTEVFKSLNLTAYDLSIDTLDMHASQTFHRFDKFNQKYNPIGESRLREIFLKYNNLIEGRFLAEVTREVFDDLESNKYQFAEYRISIYGRTMSEWDGLADWVVKYKLYSPNVKWMIQIPRLYSSYKKAGQIQNLQEMLRNIFNPLFEVTMDPASHPKLHTFLESVVGIDCVDDESIRTSFFNARDPPPSKWDSTDDPHYCSFLYYLYANLYILNKLRESRGFRTFTLRPHAGEAGDVEHIAASFLLAHGINHGLTLHHAPTLQYLYYLCQSGISMSPLSNNLLFLEYQKNPFHRYFHRGLNVALSTDDPLMIHVTKEPLVEEYSVASQVWKLSATDMCEIARNSVLQSGFEHKFKAHWLGAHYWLKGIEGNDIRCTNVPDIRVHYRHEALMREHRILAQLSGSPFDATLIDPIF